ncbi:PadR family transcriptional regulator [Bacillus sp. EB600]|uniref:PadR family transcriptional regulator n=1 Tax=Bacillus sp. EB600 TaxID=2806345 RepID=UPI00210E661C|nr:PadR family transcriptional regulator [Bacillus sp. EB600]MCQ6282464.1 PadR family transcriptional regulator [Bacillus sp. EB600]
MNTINTLGYAILGAVSRKPCSGYELAKYLEVIWPAKHSQIYPLLAKMEQQKLLDYEHVEQSGKPNKKIFSITEKGKEVLEKWIAQSPSDSISRDEFLIKIYSIRLAEKENSIKLIHERISMLEETMNRLSKKIEKIEKNKVPDPMSKNFGRYILFNRRIRLAKEEKTWCQWVLDLIKNKHLSIPILCISSKIVEKVVLSL